MSALTALTAVDERLAAQIDRVTAAVEAVGSRTAAARDRLTLALAAAQQRMADALSEIGDQVGDLVEQYEAAADGDLLALSVPEPDHVAQASQFVACEKDRPVPVKMQFEKPLTILNPDADPKTLGVATPEPDMAERVAATLAARPRSLDTLVDRLVSDELVADQASEAEEKAASPGPVNRVAEAPANREPWKNQRPADDSVAALQAEFAERLPGTTADANRVKERAEANGRPRSRRKK